MTNVLQNLDTSLEAAKTHYGLIITVGLFVITTLFALFKLYRDRAKLKITAELAIEHTDDIHGLLSVEVVNVGMRTAKIKKVFVQLQNSQMENANSDALISESSQLLLPQRAHFVEVTQEGGSHIWKGIVNQNPYFLTHERKGDKFGEGFVMLTSGRKKRFEFLLFPESGWAAIDTKSKLKKAQDDVKNAEAAKNRAQEELLLIRRRANAPYLVPSTTRFNMLMEGAANGQISGWFPGSKNLLCEFRNEVGNDLDDGDPVIFVIENTGHAARRVGLALDGERIEIFKEPDMEDSHHLQCLKYPYRKAKHGEWQNLKMTFETDNGFQDTHIYKMRHGFRELIRIDPK